MHISRSVQDSEIDGHPPRRRRKTVDSGIHEHKAKLRVTQEQSVSVGTVESQRKVCNGLLTLAMVEVRKIETRKRVNTETIQLGPVGVAKDTIGLVKKKKNPKKAASRTKIRT